MHILLKNRNIRNKSLRASSAIRFADDAFSLLELVAALAIISALTTIATVGFTGKGGILGQIKLNNIEEAKALLNTAAADCLQKSRLNNENKDIVDETIISDVRLKPIGFAVDKKSNADKCSYFQLIPVDEEDDIRFPIGFSVAEGSLSKFANPTSDYPSSITSCQRWAGVNCKQDESLKKLITWKQNIASAKKTCEENYTKWLTKDNTTPYKSSRWNPNAEIGCPTRPPKDGSESYRTDATCTPNGCNRVVYGLDGEFVGFSKQDYDLAIESKYGKLCTEWVAEKEKQQFTNSTNNLLPTTKTPECGAQEFWFFKGEDKGTKENFMQAACNSWISEKENSNPPYTNSPIGQPAKTTVCGDREFWFVDGQDQKTEDGLNARLNKKASDKCEDERNKAAASGFTGKWGPKSGPGVCAEEKYICENTIMSQDEYYKNCGVAFPEKCKLNLPTVDQDCVDYELSDQMYKKCGPRPTFPGHPDSKYRAPNNCKFVGRGRPGKWNKNEACSQWGECMGLK